MSRDYGSGTITEGTKPGTWKLRVYLGRDPVSGKPRQKQVTYTGTERSARKELARMGTEASAQTGMTFGELLDRWLLQITPTRKPKTVGEYRAKINGRIRPLLGSVPLDQLDAELLDRAYIEWLGDDLSETTVHHLHAIISAACRQAVKWGWIDRAPTELASPPPLRLKKITVPEVDELTAFYAAAIDRQDSMLATAIALAALTGARRGELVALRWSDVDLDKGRLTIARSIAVVDGKLVEGATKNHSERTIALGEDEVRILRQRWAHQSEAAEVRGVQLVSDPYLLAHGEIHDGSRPTNPDVVSHRFRRLARGLGSSCRLHDLRHFSITTLVAAGVDVRTVATRHGHARATMTLDRYAHALPERDREAAAIMGRTVRLGA